MTSLEEFVKQNVYVLLKESFEVLFKETAERISESHIEGIHGGFSKKNPYKISDKFHRKKNFWKNKNGRNSWGFIGSLDKFRRRILKRILGLLHKGVVFGSSGVDNVQFLHDVINGLVNESM